MSQDGGPMRFAQRVVRGVGEDGTRDDILIWIERRPGAVWAVGRTINLGHRTQPSPRPNDYIFEGYELGDALEAANGALSDDLSISNGDGIASRISPFQEDELLKPLERWFFGHRP